MSESDFSSLSFSSFAAFAVRILWNSVTAVETDPDSPRIEISRRPVFMERERSEICFSCPANTCQRMLLDSKGGNARK